jgi:cold shock CspA family protein
VFVRPGSLDGSLFRTLRQGQRVIFDADEVDGRFFARDLRFGMDGR